MGLMAEEGIQGFHRYYRRYNPRNCAAAWVCRYQGVRGKRSMVRVEIGDKKIRTKIDS